jgi:HlyD family secretion protein
MTANLTFTIAERNNALKLPNAALRFRPQDITPEKVRELLRESSGGEQRRGRRQDGAQPAGSPSNEPGQEKEVKERNAGQSTGSPGNDSSEPRRRRRDRQAGDSGDRPTEANSQARDSQRVTGFSPSNTAAAEGQWRVVWVLGPDKKPLPRRIQIGITDGVATEIIQGDLKEGDQIIVGQNVSGDSRPQTRQSPPGFGGAPRFGGGGGRR